MTDDTAVHDNSGNVFADLGIENADEYMAKSELDSDCPEGGSRELGSLLPQRSRSIAVMVGLERAFLGDVDVGSLFRRQFS